MIWAAAEAAAEMAIGMGTEATAVTVFITACTVWLEAASSYDD